MRNARRIEIATLFNGLGVSLRTVFPDPEENLEAYRNHRWTVLKKGGFHIVHAVPVEEELDRSFWEEWYTINEGAVIHHILFPEEPSVPYHDIYEPPERPDGLHPPEVFGRSWFVLEEPSLLAWGVHKLLRAEQVPATEAQLV